MIKEQFSDPLWSGNNKAMATKSMSDIHLLKEQAKRDRKNKALAHVKLTACKVSDDFEFNLERRKKPDETFLYKSVQHVLGDFTDFAKAIHGKESHLYLGLDNTVPGTPEVKDVEFDMPLILGKAMNGTNHAQLKKIVNNIKINGRTAEFKEPHNKIGLHLKKSPKKPPNLTVHTKNAAGIKTPSNIESILKEMTQGLAPALTDIETPVKASNETNSFTFPKSAKQHKTNVKKEPILGDENFSASKRLCDKEDDKVESSRTGTTQNLLVQKKNKSNSETSQSPARKLSSSSTSSSSDSSGSDSSSSSDTEDEKAMPDTSKKVDHENSLNSFSPKLQNNNYLGNNLNSTQPISTKNNNSKQTTTTTIDPPESLNKFSPLIMMDCWDLKKPFLYPDLDFPGIVDDFIQDSKLEKDVVNVVENSNGHNVVIEDTLPDHVFDSNVPKPCLPKKGPRILYRKDSDCTGERSKSWNKRNAEKDDKSFASVKVTSGSMGGSCLTKAQLKMPARKKSMSESGSTSADDAKVTKKLKDVKKLRRTSNSEKLTNKERYSKIDKAKRRVDNVNLLNKTEASKDKLHSPDNSGKRENSLEKSTFITNFEKIEEHHDVKTEPGDNHMSHKPTEAPSDVTIPDKTKMNSPLNSVACDTPKPSETSNRQYGLNSDDSFTRETLSHKTIPSNNEVRDLKSEAFLKCNEGLFSNSLNGMISPMNSPMISSNHAAETKIIANLSHKEPVYMDIEKPLDEKPLDNLPSFTEAELNILNTQSYSPPSNIIPGELHKKGLVFTEEELSNLETQHYSPPPALREEEKQPIIQNKISPEKKSVGENTVSVALLSPKKEKVVLNVPDERTVVPMDVETDDEDAHALSMTEPDHKPFITEMSKVSSKELVIDKELSQKQHVRDANTPMITQIQSKIEQSTPSPRNVFDIMNNFTSVMNNTELTNLKIKIPLHLITLKDSTMRNYKSRTSTIRPARRKSIALENRVSPNLEDEEVDVECIESPLKRKRKLSKKDELNSDSDDDNDTGIMDSADVKTEDNAPEVFKSPSNIAVGSLLVRIDLSKLKRRPVKKESKPGRGRPKKFRPIAEVDVKTETSDGPKLVVTEENASVTSGVQVTTIKQEQQNGDVVLNNGSNIPLTIANKQEKKKRGRPSKVKESEVIDTDACHECGTLQKDVERDAKKLTLYKRSYVNYLNEGRRLKHKSDCLKDHIERAHTYIEAVLNYVQYLIGLELSGKVGSKQGVDEFIKITTECIRVVDYVVNKYGREVNPKTNTYDRRFLFVCLRMQSILYLKLFNIKKDSTMKYSKVLSEYYKQYKPVSNAGPSLYHSKHVHNRGSTGTPSPSSPSPGPSPGGSVASVGSAGSTGSTGSNEKTANGVGPFVTIPSDMHENAFQYMQYTKYLLHGHRLWDDSEPLTTHCQAFLTKLSRSAGLLSMQSSMLHAVEYVKASLKLIKESPLS